MQALISSGHAYAADNGDVYFDVDTFPAYGQLSGRDKEDALDGVRVENDDAKRHPYDFALWKAAKPGEICWDSPWGKGRPGWHIECSAMNRAAFGDQIDIHGGGRDLISPITRTRSPRARRSRASGSQSIGRTTASSRSTGRR